MGRWPWILSFREKKQNSSRVKGVEVLSVLARVKNAKKGNLYPNCINGLTYSYVHAQFSCMQSAHGRLT
jgi:hypothetical protein